MLLATLQQTSRQLSTRTKPRPTRCPILSYSPAAAKYPRRDFRRRCVGTACPRTLGSLGIGRIENNLTNTHHARPSAIGRSPGAGAWPSGRVSGAAASRSWQSWRASSPCGLDGRAGQAGGQHGRDAGVALSVLPAATVGAGRFCLRDPLGLPAAAVRDRPAYSIRPDQPRGLVPE